MECWGWDSPQGLGLSASLKTSYLKARGGQVATEAATNCGENEHWSGERGDIQCIHCLLRGMQVSAGLRNNAWVVWTPTWTPNLVFSKLLFQVLKFLSQSLSISSYYLRMLGRNKSDKTVKISLIMSSFYHDIQLILSCLKADNEKVPG